MDALCLKCLKLNFFEGMLYWRNKGKHKHNCRIGRAGFLIIHDKLLLSIFLWF